MVDINHDNKTKYTANYDDENEYWNRKLAGNFEMGGFNPDKCKDAAGKFESAEVSFEIYKDTFSKIMKISNKSDYGIYAILLSALSFTIYKYSGNNDIIIGFPLIKHDNSRDNVCGLLPIRCKIDTECSYKTYLASLGQNIIDTIKNQHISINETVKKRIAYKIALVMDSIHGSNADDNRGIDMVVSFKIKDMTIEGCIKYNGILFEKETIKRITGHINKCLEVTLGNPDILLEDISILQEAEVNQILYEFNNIRSDYCYDKTINQLFEEQAEKTPDAIAVIYDGRTMTYEDLNTSANQLACFLISKGVKPDSIVGIMVDRSFDMLVGIMGILKAGGAYLPIDPEYPSERIKYMLEDSGTSILLTHKEFAAELDFNGEIIRLDASEIYKVKAQNCEGIAKPDNLAYVIYTSGTTGKPKGVMIEHKNVISLFYTARILFDFNESDIWTLFHSYCFDFSVWEMYGALLYGGKLVVIPKSVARDTKAYLNLLKKEKVTILNQTPSAFYRLIEEELKNGEKALLIRNIIFGGEALKPIVLKEFRAKYPNIKFINMYGITETTVHVTYKEITDKEIERNISNIGKPIPTLSAYVLDKGMQLLPLGGAGELCVSGEGVARGYLNREMLTMDKFIENPYKSGERLYKSGDLVRMLFTGEMEYLGRIDQQVKVRGYRIELGEIENHLLNNKSIKEVIVMARDDESGNKYLCAYVVADKELMLKDMRGYLAEYLPDYMIPSYFIQLNEMPLNPNGKVDRDKLLRIEITPTREKEYKAPKTENEKILVNIWSKLFSMDKIGVEDDFISLGGHSLKAVDLALKVQEVFNVDIPIGMIFKLSNIRNFAHYIEKAEKSNFAEIDAIDKKEYYSVSSAQCRMFILNGFSKESIAYNLPYAWTVKGALDIHRFRNALTELIKRHEAFRTSFHIQNGEVVQKIHESINYKFEFVDINVQDISTAIKDFIKPFNLEEAPLIRVKLLRNSELEHILLLDIHHIIADAVSVGILFKELADLYIGNPLPKLKVQYKEYSNWQKSSAFLNQLKEQEKYWLSVFDGIIPVLNMPLDYMRRQTYSTEGDHVLFSINGELYAQLKNFSLDNNLTMFTILLTAYIMLLSKYTGQNDIVVGIPVAGRRHKDINNIMGMFVNTLAIKSYPHKNKTVLQFLNEVNDSLLHAYENQEYPFEDLVDKLGVKRDYGRNPIFDTMFNMLSKPEIKIPGLDFIKHTIETGNSQFDIEMDGEEGDKGIDFCLGYNVGLYKKATLERFALRYLKVIEKMINNKDVELIEIVL